MIESANEPQEYLVLFILTGMSLLGFSLGVAFMNFITDNSFERGLKNAIIKFFHWLRKKREVNLSFKKMKWKGRFRIRKVEYGSGLGKFVVEQKHNDYDCFYWKEMRSFENYCEAFEFAEAEFKKYYSEIVVSNKILVR